MTIERLNEAKELLEKGFPYEFARKNIDALIDAEIKRNQGCWHCRGIESHEIDHVKTYVDAYGHELGAYDVPLRHCPSCGRKLIGDG